jgi:hypothetical protein
MGGEIGARDGARNAPGGGLRPPGRGLSSLVDALAGLFEPLEDVVELVGLTMNSWKPSMPTLAISAGASRSKNCAMPPGGRQHLEALPEELGSSSSTLDCALTGSWPRFSRSSWSGRRRRDIGRNFLASSTFFAPAGMWKVSVGASSARGTSRVDFRELV